MPHRKNGASNSYGFYLTLLGISLSSQDGQSNIWFSSGPGTAMVSKRLSSFPWPPVLKLGPNLMLNPYYSVPKAFKPRDF